MREEHAAHAEEISNHSHAVHQRAFDDFEGTAVLLKGFFGVFVDEPVDALEQGVFKAPFNGAVAPSQVFLDFLPALAFEAFGEIEQTLGGVRAAVEQHVFDALEQLLGDLIIDL